MCPRRGDVDLIDINWGDKLGGGEEELMVVVPRGIADYIKPFSD